MSTAARGMIAIPGETRFFRLRVSVGAPKTPATVDVLDMRGSKNLVSDHFRRNEPTVDMNEAANIAKGGSKMSAYLNILKLR